MHLIKIWQLRFRRNLPLDIRQRIWMVEFEYFGILRTLLVLSILIQEGYFYVKNSFHKNFKILLLKIGISVTTPSIASLFKVDDKYFKTVFESFAKKFDVVDTSLLPFVKDNNTFVGIEVEMEDTLNKFSSGLYEHLWTFRADGSLRNNGLEAVSIPLKGEWIKRGLKTLFDCIKNIHFSPRTSIHIHLDVRELNLNQ